MKTNIVTKGESNENPPILILHGWGASTKSWEKVQNELSNLRYKVIVPDMPGFGESAPPEKPWTSDDYLSWLLGFIKEQKITTPFYLVGHSFGGSLALKLAIKHPELIRKLIVISAARSGHAKTSLKVRVIKRIVRIGKSTEKLPFFKLMRKAFYKFIVQERDYERTEGVMRKTMELVLKDNLTHDLHKIHLPTLIIWGENDKATPIEDAHVINHEIKGSELRIVKGGKHAINLTHPYEVSEFIYKFLK